LVSYGISICGASAVFSVAKILFPDEKSHEEAQNAAPRANKFPNIFVAIMSIGTIPFIPLLPYIGSNFHDINDIIRGSWIGGSIDSTGAVIASSSLFNSKKILHFAIIIKMLQNLLIGPIALFTTILQTNQIKWIILWEKFPKFIIGFLITASIVIFIPNNSMHIVANNSFILSE
jgi:uncharacterized membrane protein YadS